MCGIYGIVALRPQRPFDREELAPMAAVTVHRGPDDEGSYLGDGVLLGMRRLSIIDLSGGHQPISNRDGSLWVVCNGEIYNFRELRAELEARGHPFATGSDTEVLLHAYTEYGDRFIEHIGGMFAFALWDARRRRLVLGRDRLGIKPLYYLERDGRLIFASEAKAILALPGVRAELDPVGLDQYLALGYAPAPYSMFRGIRKLPVASLLTVEDGRIAIERYWQLPREADESRSEADWAEELGARLERCVASQMVSDVPIGAFLSGGIDSSAVVASMARASSQPVKTYAIGFDTGSADQYYNELPYARRIAERFGTDHHEIVVRPDVARLLPRLLWQMDEPIADSAFVTTYLVAEFARRDVTVILSGVGGDELFGGYRRYLGEHYARTYRRLPRALRTGVLAPLARRLPADRHSPLLNLSRLARGFLLSSELSLAERYRAYVGVFGADWRARLLRSPNGREFDALAEAFRASSQNDPLRAMFEVDLLTQLPDDLLLLTDKMTMATSLECRVPLLDHELVELAARIPSRLKIRGGRLKHVLKRALAGRLPAEILERPKRGFGAPMGAWIKRELAGLTSRLLAPEAVRRRGLLEPAVVAEAIELHRTAREDHTDHLLALINLELWCRIFLDRRSAEDVTLEVQREMA
ncbi:MAG TPA: asparagine synthase (glutamine-hydrolyzing) [Candidatus Polarisedimenticolaceae bacterium]|nr:asparagine synthase (glutamine-hydrolyzing) [Candidatus Polarisedimenticolaceae bacterium]